MVSMSMTSMCTKPDSARSLSTSHPRPPAPTHSTLRARARRGHAVGGCCEVARGALATLVAHAPQAARTAWRACVEACRNGRAGGCMHGATSRMLRVPRWSGTPLAARAPPSGCAAAPRAVPGQRAAPCAGCTRVLHLALLPCPCPHMPPRTSSCTAHTHTNPHTHLQSSDWMNSRSSGPASNPGPTKLPCRVSSRSRSRQRCAASMLPPACCCRALRHGPARGAAGGAWAEQRGAWAAGRGSGAHSMLCACACGPIGAVRGACLGVRAPRGGVQHAGRPARGAHAPHAGLL